MLHDKYKGRCVIGGFRVLPYNRFRESVHHFFPTLKLEKTKTDMCNECFRIKIKLSDPDISEEEKLGLKKKLSVHLGESNIQRRAMNAYRQELSPSDPVPHRPPCSVEEINYKVLLEAMNLHKSNPGLDCDLDDLETIYMDDDQMESDAMDIGGISSILLYHERSGGKDVNRVCSVRWEALMIKYKKHALNATIPADHHVGIYDNCTGQNKSNVVFKFKLFQILLGFFKTKSKLFLM